MAIGKKAIFFTLTSIILLGMMFFFLALRQELKPKIEMPLINSRISKANDFIVDLENSYIPRISSQHAFAIAKDNISAIETDLIPILGTVFKDISKIARTKMNLEIELNETNIKNIELFQDNTTGPWNIGMNIEVDYFVSTAIANWSRNANIKTTFSIIGLKDPEPPFELITIETYQPRSGKKSFLERIPLGTTEANCCGFDRIFT